MKPGAVIVDVAIDQGGCVETSRPTTHRQPTYIVDDVVHYCVTNMPGAVGRTSTYALCNVTLPYVLQLARNGWRTVAAADPGRRRGGQHRPGPGDQPGRRRDLRPALQRPGRSGRRPPSERLEDARLRRPLRADRHADTVSVDATHPG